MNLKKRIAASVVIVMVGALGVAMLAKGQGMQTAMAATTNTEGCAGEWTRAVAYINDPANQNQMVIRNAANLQDAVRRAHICRSDVGNVSYFQEGARLACAPYIACSAP